MNERKYKRLKAEYEWMSEQRSELLRRIQAAEEDLKELAALMGEHEREGNQEAYEELDNVYQQAYPDYTKMLRQLPVIDEVLAEMEPFLQAVDEYVRDTGFYPGLK